MEIEPVTRLTKDLANAAKTLSPGEARFLVDAYYTMQEDRIRSGNQVAALSEADEPHDVLLWLAHQSETLENQIRRALQKFAEAHPVGQWMLSVHGIGPVIAAGLLAHIDITKAPTVGHIWRFAGLDPTSKWTKGQKRPFNAKLKVVAWKAGESFVKVSGNEAAVYGRHYVNRKLYEIEKNQQGAYSEQALEVLKVKKIGSETEAYLWYSGKLAAADSATYYTTPSEKRVGLSKKLAAARAEGEGHPMLPPAHIHARAKRWATKLFLAHAHHVWHEYEFGTPPPLPYPIAILGHAHLIPPASPATPLTVVESEG